MQMAGQKRKDTAQSSNKPSKMPRRVPGKKNKKDGNLDAQPFNQHASVFFRLPREIRDIIYREILVFPVTVHLAYVGTTRTCRFRSFLCQLSEDEQPEKRPAAALPAMSNQPSPLLTTEGDV